MSNTIITLVLIVLLVLYLYINVIGEPAQEHFSSGYASNEDQYIKPFIVNDILTSTECKEIIEFCKDKLVDSEVVGGKHHNIRNSKQCWISKSNVIVKNLFEKVGSMFNIPVENAEDLQVVRYQPNQYYNEHHDSCCDENEKCKEFAKRGGQRRLTVLIYLNDGFEGGLTKFKNLDLQMKAPIGSAIVFYPLALNKNICHPLALHAGMPVSEGEKWVANLWFRESKFV
jgi:prolyl 4-hydroxylase